MFHFPGQFEHEEVERVVRKHPIVYIKVVIGFFLVVALPLLVFLPLYYFQYPLAQYPQAGFTVGIFASIFLLYGLLFTVISWLHEAFDLFLITNERLVDFTQVNLLNRTMASTPLERIQDTTGHIDGFFPTLFNYGTLEIQTAAGEASEFLIDRIRRPNHVAKYILERAHEIREQKGAQGL